MTYHDWGDKDFDWEALNNAGEYISSYCMKRARLYIHWKEKYGTLRYQHLSSCIFNRYWPIHTLINPGHLYYRFPRWMINIEYIVGDVLYYIGVVKIIQKYQLWILKRALLRAVKKFPHIKDEILADTPEEIGDERNE